MLKLSTLLRSTLSSVMLSLLLAAGSGCKDSSQSQGVGWQPNVPFGTLPPGFDSFPERWNKQINDRLAREEEANSLRMKPPCPSFTAGRRKATTSNSRPRRTSPKT